MSTNILGISAYYHDSAAALVRDGEIIAAAQEERFTRIRHDHEFPHRAIAFCLTNAKITPEDLTAVVFYDKPFLKFERILETYLQYAPRGYRSFIKAIPLWLKKKIWIKSLISEALPGYSGDILFTEHHHSHAASAFYPSPYAEAAIITTDGVGEWTTTSIGFGKDTDIKILKEIHFPHSLGLLYSAFTYYTGFKVNSGEYKVMGLAPYGEPKYVPAILDHLIDIKDDGSFKLNMNYFNYAAGLTMTSKKFDRLFGGPPRKMESALRSRDMDLARSVQEVVETVMLKLAGHARQVTGSENLCLAGGVALNCVANGNILRQKLFKNIWIQPAAGDAGGALGAALAIWYEYLGKSKTESRMQNAVIGDAQKGSYLGPEFSDEEIRVFLDGNKIPYSELKMGSMLNHGRFSPDKSSGRRHHLSGELGTGNSELGTGNSQESTQSQVSSSNDVSLIGDDDLFKTVAKLLSEENVIGWFQGKMEFGPRALGSRSILGDPRSAEMQTKMNLKIKYRESFRPFAPAVPAEDTAHWFDIDRESPYMLLTADVRIEKRIKRGDGAAHGNAPFRGAWSVEREEEEQALHGIEKLQVVRSEIPAVTHVDYSARLQTVHPETNPRFSALLIAFKALTGCPVLVNTSFNVRGEPIVCTPDDAYACFMRTEMDYLVMGPFLLDKKDQPAYEEKDGWRKKFALD